MASITGYGAVFNSPSHDLGGFIEYIDPHAFDAVLAARPDVLILYNHDEDYLLGRTASRTASVSVDEHGLRYSCTLPDTTLGNDVYQLVRRGDLQGSSFGFVPTEDKWEVTSSGQYVRTILKVGVLIDCSPVTSPAYPGASVKI